MTVITPCKVPQVRRGTRASRAVRLDGKIMGSCYDDSFAVYDLHVFLCLLHHN